MQPGAREYLILHTTSLLHMPLGCKAAYAFGVGHVHANPHRVCLLLLCRYDDNGG
jgi:hypothetical protein